MNNSINKRSFLIIEILLGFILLVIFISTFLSIPKITQKNLLKKTLEIELSHYSDRDFFSWVHDKKNLIQLAPSPNQKGKPLEISLSDEPIELIDLYKGRVEKKGIVTLLEVKHLKNGALLFLYHFQIDYTLYLHKEIFKKTYSHSFLVKEDCN